MSKIYGNKDEKVALLEVFHHTMKTKFIQKLAGMFDRFAEFIKIV